MKRIHPFAYMPPSLLEYVYTVFFKPRALRLLVQSIVKRFIPAEMRIRGVDLVMNQDDAIVCGSLALGCYERFELDVFDGLLKPGMCVLDIGANIGLYAAIAADRVGPTGRVIAIEPERANCDFIRRTVQRNRFQNVRIIQKAVSNATGTGKLFLCELNKADHRIYDPRAERPSVETELIRLDDFLEANGISRVDLIKMDIQGAEALAIEGMLETLKRNRSIRVMMEFWPWGIKQAGGDPRGLLRTLRALKFEIHELCGDQRATRPVTDDDELSSRGLERQHANLLLQRGD